MKQDKDIGFDISAFLESAGNANHFYVYQWQIENNGCFKIKQDDDLVKVFTPQLSLVLLTREIATFDKEQNIETIINGLDYINSYVEGFKKGEQYFEAKFQVSADVRYGANAEDYVMDIHDNYFHRQHITGFEGWGFVKSNFPITLTHKRVWEFGYYSGIVNKVEEQIKAHPRIFAKFEKCEHNLPPQQFETKSDKLKVSQIALIHVYEGKQITRENAGLIAAKHGYTAKNSGEGLFQDYTYYSSTANRKEKPTLCTPKKLKNKIKLFESIVNHLPDNSKQRAIDEINILKTIYENEYQ